MERMGNRIWHEASKNQNLDVVQLIFSLKDIQPEILNYNGENVFLIACEKSNLKIIKFIRKIFSSFIHSQLQNNYNNNNNNNNMENWKFINAAYIVLFRSKLKSSDKLKVLHYLYLNGLIFILLLLVNTIHVIRVFIL